MATKEFSRYPTEYKMLIKLYILVQSTGGLDISVDGLISHDWGEGGNSYSQAQVTNMTKGKY